ncbi:MAG: hypothetical protein AAF206_04425 [Bacteroidota bacterium]
MNDAENPFKQFLPDEEPKPEAGHQEVMNSIQLKGHLFNILEFFASIFGFAMSDQGSQTGPADPTEPTP